MHCKCAASARGTAAPIARPGVWVGVVIDKENDAANPPAFVYPCVIPFDRYRVLSTQTPPGTTAAWCCGRPALRNAGHAGGAPVASVFVSLDPERQPVKGPYTRFHTDQLTALLYTPGILSAWAFGGVGCYVDASSDAQGVDASSRGGEPTPSTGAAEGDDTPSSRSPTTATRRPRPSDIDLLHTVLCGMVPDFTQPRLVALKERVDGFIAAAGGARVIRHDRFPTLFHALVAALVLCLCDVEFAMDGYPAIEDALYAAVWNERDRRALIIEKFAEHHGINAAAAAAAAAEGVTSCGRGAASTAAHFDAAVARMRRLLRDLSTLAKDTLRKQKRQWTEGGASAPKVPTSEEWRRVLCGRVETKRPSSENDTGATTPVGGPLYTMLTALASEEGHEAAGTTASAMGARHHANPASPDAKPMHAASGAGDTGVVGNASASTPAASTDYDADLLRMADPRRLAVVRESYAVDAGFTDLRLLQPVLDRGYLAHPYALWEHAALPEGFVYFPDFVTDEEEAGMLASVASDLAPGQSFSTHVMRRRIAHYGFPYKYPDGGIDLDNPLPEGLSEWQRGLAGRIEAACGARGGTLTQMTANEYTPGQGISSHFDEFTTIGELLVTLSLGSDVAMQLVEPTSGRKVEVLLRRKSLAVFIGDARYAWTHGIPKRSVDKAAAAGTPPSKRAHRVSLTYRNCPPTKDWRAT